ncbi:type 1 glutamine amidotransferase [Actinoallomurus sp. NBC_01490]|jgi:GMP synthase-like glutamine amidotransferase|uniref:type 1 glutamine amidotransferase n=1 Tax=Actinoallomurus sp. NBC_01490 TaxID=2903557 RepID=UPI002E32DF22|nr:type 1 glutamine amidotransferase [Actinoallomurus sp. NBC_01490]
MATRALVLVHDPAESRLHRIPGALIPALARRDIEHDVASFVAGHGPEPGLDGYDLLVVMGAGKSVYDQSVPWIADELAFVGSAVERELPVLGICFGGQLLAQCLNGTVTRAARSEIGFTLVDSDDPDLIPCGPWMQFHADSFTPPPAAREIARNAAGSQAFVVGRALGVQFHPEITLDSFSSWTERWTADGESLGNLDIDALRHEVAHHERRSVSICDQLVGAFCARHLGR